MIVGVIMTMTKFWYKELVEFGHERKACKGHDSQLTQSQLDEVAMAEPLARACSGRISGTYTQGIQFTEAPNMNMYCLILAESGVGP